MKLNEIIIEVKTKWVQKEDGYERHIIEYACKNNQVSNALEATKFLFESRNYSEVSRTIDTNEYEICAKYLKNNKKLDEPNEFISTLIDFTKRQWTGE